MAIRGECAQLGEQAQAVDAVPVLDDFAVGDAHDIDDQNLDAAAGRRNALHGAVMRPMQHQELGAQR